MFNFADSYLAANRYHTKNWSLGVILLLLIFILPSAKSEEEAFYVAPADNSSPRATFEGFLTLCNQAYDLFIKEAEGGAEITKTQKKRLVDELLRHLDLGEEPKFTRLTTGKQASACIKEILDRVDLPHLDEIPGPDELTADSESGLLERWRIPGTDLVIHRVTEGPRDGDYLFSPESVTAAIENYEVIRELPYNKKSTPNFYAWYLTHPGNLIEPLIKALPESSRTHLVGNQAVWQWFALGIAIILALLFIILSYFFGRKISSRVKDSGSWRYSLTLFFPIIAMFIPLAFIVLVRDQIRIAGPLLSVLSFAANLMFLLASTIVINALGNRIAEFIISKPGIHSKGLDAQFIRIIARVTSLILAIIVFLEGGKYLGIPISTLLASAGVGGLAFALAAQDSLKNFFGSIMIYMDKPYRIGERIVVKNYDGVVEEIGIRSTRLRLLNGHQATIPNEEMARSDIENVGRRNHIRRLTDLRLSVDTTPDKMEEAVAIIKEILENHEGMKPDFPPRVFFSEIQHTHLVLRFIYWYHPPEIWEYMRFSQEVNLRIQRDFKKEGITIDVPMRQLNIDPIEDAEVNNDPEEIVE